MHRQEAQNCLEQANEFYDRENYEKAEVYYKKALSYFKDSNARIEEADSFLMLGNVYLELKKFQEAQKYYQQSLDIYAGAKEKIGEGYSLTGLGVVQEYLGEQDQARSYYRQASKKFRSAGDDKREAVVQSLIAGTYESQGAWENALQDYRKSSEMFSKLGNREKEQEIEDKTHEIGVKRSQSKLSRRQLATAVIYLLALIVAEMTVAHYNVEIGLMLELFILFALLFNFAFTFNSSYNFSVLLLSMMALPLIRIIGLNIPLMQIPALYWFPIVAIPLFATTFVIMKIQGLSRESIGLIWGNIPLQFVIAATGIFLGTFEYLILQPKPLIPTLNTQSLIIASIILIISTGFAEELLFRGIIQKNAQNVFGAMFGLLYTALLFTALHIGWNNFYDLIFVFSVGLFYGYAFYKTKSIIGVTLSHGLSNTFLFLIIPFYVPLVYSLIPHL